MKPDSVVVVGGGIVGTACAWRLRLAGCDVTLLDSRNFRGGCSHGNCGFVCPSHVLPLAEPGAVSSGLLSMLKRNSPLSIKPRLDWDLWAWMLAFARRCNERDMLAAGHALHPLLRVSHAEYERMASDGVISCGMQKRGLLFAFRQQHAFEDFAKTDRILTDVFDEPAVRYAGDAVQELEPALRDGLAGGWHYEDELHLDPALLMASWHATLEREGVRFRGGKSVTSIAGEGRAAAVAADGEEIAADAFVFAVGAATPLLSDLLGVRLPIQPGKGYSITFPRPEHSPSVAMLLPEARVGVTPLQDHLRLGSTMEFAGYDDSIRPERLRLLREGAAPYLKARLPETDDQAWYGWRPMTPDGLPFIDRAPKFENVWIAAGHNMLGVSTAPATGMMIASLVTGAPPTIDPAPYAVGRKRNAAPRREASASPAAARV